MNIMIKDFEGKVAVITGAASGIGRGLAFGFAKRGMKIVLADIDKVNLDKVAKELEEIGVEVMTQLTDVSDPKQMAQLADASYERYGIVNILCNNAGVGGAGSISLITLENWKWTLDVNLFGVIHGIHYFLNRMLASKHPCHIINMSSMAGLLTGDTSSYPTSKFAVVAISESLALECFNTNVVVSVVCPGRVNTNIINNTTMFRQERQDIWQPPAEMIEQSEIGRENLNKILRQAMVPEKLAEIVIRAIENDIFYVLTHPEYIPLVKSRFERIYEDTLKLHEGIAAKSAENLKIFKNDAPVFSIAYPESFIELKPNPMNFPTGKRVLVAAKDPGIDLLISVFKSSKEDRPLDESVQKIAKGIETIAREVNISSNEPVTLKDGTSAYESVIEFKSSGIFKVKSIHLSVLKDEYRIIISISANINYYNERLRDILYSLEFY
ncbi:MAG: SDR family NAD(P)-dependent oxidoreductase [Candidatus Lokiarchaeota archaeon]|nr:SDR family NAD(P)-dependent oxidoreductase [Candidatus Lokiarchaeota archaeon]